MHFPCKTPDLPELCLPAGGWIHGNLETPACPAGGEEEPEANPARPGYALEPGAMGSGMRRAASFSSAGMRRRKRALAAGTMLSPRDRQAPPDEDRRGSEQGCSTAELGREPKGFHGWQSWERPPPIPPFVVRDRLIE